LSQQIEISGSAASLGSIKHSGRLKYRAIQLTYLAQNWRAHRQYLNQLKVFQESDVIPHNSLINYKYIGNYLALSRSREWRREIIVSNYQIIYDLSRTAAHATLFARSTTIWSRLASLDTGATDQRIILQPSTIAPLEGEFELQFFLGTKLLATLTFVFASGVLVEAEDQAVCLIGSLQGGHDCRTEIRQAAKLNGEISPFTMLVLALKALTEAMNVAKLFGVSSNDQVALRGESRAGLDYDAMWAREGGSLQPNGFFLLEPLNSKPLVQISQSHRKRAQRKRERKAGAVLVMEEAFQSYLS
jgi:uncharacterized protein VirK/YbjX